jgi:aminopeptidase N
MTYQKAPEFVRMIETILGRKTFARGLDLYHTKFAYSNASTSDWVHSMELASSEDPAKRLNFTKMADGWLKRTGFPEVSFTTAYDAAAKKFTVNLKQTGFQGKTPAGPWDFPIEWSLVKVDTETKDGKTISKPRILATGVHRFFVEEETQVISGVKEAPDYVSFAQDWSYYGKYTHTVCISIHASSFCAVFAFSQPSTLTAPI